MNANKEDANGEKDQYPPSSFAQRYAGALTELGIAALFRLNWSEAQVRGWTLERVAADFHELDPADFRREVLNAAILARSDAIGAAYVRASAALRTECRRKVVIPVIALANEEPPAVNLWDPANFQLEREFAGCNEEEALVTMYYVNAVLRRQEGRWPLVGPGRHERTSNAVDDESGAM